MLPDINKLEVFIAFFAGLVLGFLAFMLALTVPIGY
jgi:hypothetical protein